VLSALYFSTATSTREDKMKAQRRDFKRLFNLVTICIQVGLGLLLSLLANSSANAQLIDRTVAPNAVNAGIAKSLTQQIGTGRGDILTENSSAFIIARDPFRSVRRGRQIFQRKFTLEQGLGPIVGDGMGNIGADNRIGAGLADSCAACHGRPRGGAGSGGDVATRPDSRDAPHLYGLGLKEMLADEITTDLRAIRTQVIASARQANKRVSQDLVAKGIHYGRIAALGDGTLDTAEVSGVDADLRVRPFAAHGSTVSIREFVVGAFQNEMGLQAVDADTMRASKGGRVVTPSGMVLDGALDKLEAPPTDSPTADPDGDGLVNEIPTSIIDHMEQYLLNYFKPGTYKQDEMTAIGKFEFERIGCASCHIPNLTVQRDRRVGNVDTVYDAAKGIFNRLFATAGTLHGLINDGTAFPPLKPALLQPFAVKNIFTDFKRHDLGPNFHERNYDGTIQKLFMTTPLWGVGSTGPYGHDGRSINLTEVILRHGGEAQAARDKFARLYRFEQETILAMLNSLVLFGPDDTASNLDPGNPVTAGFPQLGHGSIALKALFVNPADPE
jgi:hypothetical protein